MTKPRKAALARKEYATARSLINENTGYGFFGVAAQALGYRQAAAAYNEAMHLVCQNGHTQGVAAEFLASKAGRWWADGLDWKADYGDQQACIGAVFNALGDSRMNLDRAVAEYTKA